MISFNGTEWVDLDDEIKSGSGSKVNNVYYGSNLVYPDIERIPVPKPIKGYHYYYEFEYYGYENYEFNGIDPTTLDSMSDKTYATPKTDIEYDKCENHYCYYTQFHINKSMHLKVKILSKLPIYNHYYDGKLNVKIPLSKKSFYYNNGITEDEYNNPNKFRSVTLYYPSTIHVSTMAFDKNYTDSFWINENNKSCFDKILKAYESLAYSEPITKISCILDFNIKYSPIKFKASPDYGLLYKVHTIPFIGGDTLEYLGCIKYNDYKQTDTVSPPMSYSFHLNGKNEAGVYSSRNGFVPHTKDNVFYLRKNMWALTIFNDTETLYKQAQNNELNKKKYGRILDYKRDDDEYYNYGGSEISNLSDISPDHYNDSNYEVVHVINFPTMYGLTLMNLMPRGKIKSTINGNGDFNSPTHYFGSNWYTSKFLNDIHSMGYPHIDLDVPEGGAVHPTNYRGYFDRVTSTHKYSYDGNFVCYTNAVDRRTDKLYHQYLFDRNYEKLIEKLYNKDKKYVIKMPSNYYYSQDGFLGGTKGVDFNDIICDCFYQCKLQKNYNYPLLDSNIVSDTYRSSNNNSTVYRWFLRKGK